MRHFRVHLVLILVALLVSSSPVTQVVAQFDGEDETCPEGLVYDQIADLCVLPEEIADEAVEDQPQTIIAVDEQIKNLTVLAFSCPINWNPATRDIVASREMCADPVVPAPTLTILFDGSVVATTPPVVRSMWPTILPSLAFRVRPECGRSRKISRRDSKTPSPFAPFSMRRAFHG